MLVVSQDDEDGGGDEEKDKHVKKSKSERKEHKKHKKHKKEKKHKKDKKDERHKKHHSSSSSSSKSKSNGSRPTTVKREHTDTKLKTLNKLDRVEFAIKAHRWWDAAELPEGIQWRTLEHSGMHFAPDYVPHGVPLLYDGAPVALSPELEEIATFYAGIPLDGPQLGKPKTAKVFSANFFNDFKAKLPKGHVIKSFEKCDFTRIRMHLEEAKLVKKAATEAEKAELKARNQELLMHNGFAIVDGVLQKVGNFRMEPPGLFRGRGEHPGTGKLKERALPERVTVNVGLDAVPPVVHLPGRCWKEVVHKPDVTWLAAWNENVLNQNKYVMLSASSSFKGKSDRDKYAKAMLLKRYIGKIRADYEKNLRSKDNAARQLATAMWIIDKLALRVGGEKGEEEADTVGCCSLRVEHVRFQERADGKHAIELEFLGKDSMLYKDTVELVDRYGEIGERVYANLKGFCSAKGKTQGSDIFETLSPPTLNAHLSSLMPGLTAKVFRTYNASITLEEQLRDYPNIREVDVKVAAYNDANREVAILCNHQRTVPQSMLDSLAKQSDRVTQLQAQLEELQNWLKLVKKGKEVPRLRAEGLDAVAAAERAIEESKSMIAAASTKEEKLAATQAKQRADELRRASAAAKFSEGHLFARQPSQEQLEKRIEAWEAKVRKEQRSMSSKDATKDVALGTSKINYMDPRISVAWCKRNEVPIEKVFAKALRDKFNWACAVPTTWTFDPNTNNL